MCYGLHYFSILDLVMPNKYKRYQKGWKMSHHYPKRGLYCACGCGIKLKGKQSRWSSEQCSENAYLNYSILKGNTETIRKELFKMEQGFCRSCGIYDSEWQADHIVPVILGGGFSTINNFQTLCPNCHNEKTISQMAYHRSAISSQAASKDFIVRL